MQEERVKRQDHHHRLLQTVRQVRVTEREHDYGQ